ncbi:energy transducer TonB [Flavobacterium sp.]|uniref:energy transducer TonB n=1 Tax=Flavobacterium sp. TaxID=239 RepID=UPI0039E67D34
MKKIVFFLLLAWSVSAQNTSDRKIYLDSTFAETTEDRHHFYRIVTDYHKKQLTYHMVDYYKSGNIYSQCYSTSNNKQSPVGQLTKYYENGNKKSISSYEDGALTGAYTTWHQNGNPEMEGEYIPIESEGIKRSVKESMLKINQFWDSNNQIKVKDGHGYCVIVHDKGCDEGSVKNGVKDSLWAGSENFKYTYVEKYKDGKLVSGTSVDQDGQYFYTSIEEQAEYPGGIIAFPKYVQKNFRIPEVRGLNGKLVISFVIEKDGSVGDIRIVKSMGEAADNEATRVVSESLAWKPGKVRGRKMRILYSIPINIVTPD